VVSELGANGLHFSVHYDTRFSKSDKGLGIRAGAGFFGGSGGRIVTIPVKLNHFVGKAPNYFDTGFGYT
jgi:hypothetical protein